MISCNLREATTAAPQSEYDYNNISKLFGVYHTRNGANIHKWIILQLAVFVWVDAKAHASQDCSFLWSKQVG